MSSQYYTRSFYDEHRDGATISAEVILPLVLELIRVRSVVDVGCGEGNWLAVFEKLGVDEILGIDGDYVDRSHLQIKQSQFQAPDLTEPFNLGRVFDLAMSLEVAEHLPPECAANFVESLTRLAPLVLFSAAIPFQGGDHHVNEQWPDKWAGLFQQHGYVPVDFLRKRIWQNKAVEWWYAQNTLLFARSDVLESNAAMLVEYKCSNASQICLVHPRQYLHLQNLYQKAMIPSEPPSWGIVGASRLLLNAIKSAWIRRLSSSQSKLSSSRSDSRKEIV